MKYAQRADYETAAKYLQLNTAKQVQEGPETARQLLVLMNSSYRGSIAALSNVPEGNVEDSEALNQERAGRFEAGDQAGDLVLVRTFPKSGAPFWLISQETLAQVPDLYQRVGAPHLLRYFPESLQRNGFQGIPYGQWLVWILCLPLSWLIAWGLVRFGEWAWGLRRARVAYSPAHPMRNPSILTVALLVDSALIFRVGMPVFYRVYYFRAVAILLTLSVAWLSSSVADQVYSYARASKLRGDSRSFLQLAHRLNNAVIYIIAALVIVTLMGFDTKTMLAGLGIGGIALALAAQRTLENLIGGITLVMDKTASVGDDCIITGRSVTVQEIGLRSLRVITREGTEIAFPNGMLSQTSIENISRRVRFPIAATLSLSYECSLAQVQLVIARVREILYSHARIEPETAVFRLSGITSAGFQVDLFAYVRSSDGSEFNAIREDVLFRILEVVQSAGAAWAIPSQVAYVSKEQAVKEEKMNAAEETVRRWQESNQVPFPDLSAQRIAELRGTLPYPPERSALRQASDPAKKSA